ncbi:MAG: hypothetical protein Phog2KO_43880 [Phototrophicaceae bacterium]
MIEEKEIFVDGERRLGRYTVVLLSQTGTGRWMTSMMQLDSVVTNYRLLLRPFRKKYRPASLPAQYIKSMEMTTQGHYHCIKLLLITEHILYVTLSTGKLDDLYDDLRAMKSPAPKFQFDESIAKKDIQRLVNFFDKQLLETPSTDT